MNVYEAKLRKDTDVERISIVLGAAVETKLSKFAQENETPVFFANEEKRIIYSVAMRPNKMIFRKDIYGEPANVFFTPETVEQIQQSYFRSNNKGLVKMNLNHADENVDGVYPIESWIVNDPEVDKSKTLLMEDVKAKDLIIGYKIDNDDVWENFIKTGQVDGLSIEAYLDYELPKPITNMNTEETQKDNFFTHMAKFFAPTKMAEEVTEVIEEVVEEDFKEKYEALLAENNDLKEKLAEYQAKEVEAATELETMKAEFETFKAENTGVKNVPNEVVIDPANMRPVDKYRASKLN